MLADLQALFDDRLRMWGSHSSSGGIVREGLEDQSLHEDELQYVWSGPISNAA